MMLIDILHLKAQVLRSYVEKTWISVGFPPSLWMHFDNEGPRTSHQAEVWHNSLKSPF